jgi:nucleoside permease NupC
MFRPWEVFIRLALGRFKRNMRRISSSAMQFVFLLECSKASEDELFLMFHVLCTVVCVCVSTDISSFLSICPVLITFLKKSVQKQFLWLNIAMGEEVK